MTTQTAPPETVPEEFGERVLGILNDASTAFQLSIGHRTGLLDHLADLPPATSGKIAAETGLQERYVREWLDALTVARIVEHDPERLEYRLPAENAAFLTRAAGPDNIAFYMQYLSALFGAVEDDVVEAFRAGGGVPYDQVPRFAEIQREETARVYDVALVDDILPLAPGLPDRLAAGADVADIGCGGGHAINVMAKAFPRSWFVGFDFSEQAIELARAEAADWKLTNARFEVRDIVDIAGEHDLITAFDVIHDSAHPAKVLSSVWRALRPGGTFLMGDIAASSIVEENIEHPLAPTIYGFSVFHCMTVSLSQGGTGLGTAWGKQLALRYLADAGFTDIEVKQIEGDILNAYYVCPKG